MRVCRQAKADAAYRSRMREYQETLRSVDPRVHYKYAPKPLGTPAPDFDSMHRQWETQMMVARANMLKRPTVPKVRVRACGETVASRPAHTFQSLGALRFRWRPKDFSHSPPAMGSSRGAPARAANVLLLSKARVCLPSLVAGGA